MKKASVLMVICSLFIMGSMAPAEARGNHGAGKAHKSAAGKVHRAAGHAGKAVRGHGGNASGVKFI